MQMRSKCGERERERVKRYYEHVFTKSELALGVSDTIGGLIWRVLSAVVPVLRS